MKNLSLLLIILFAPLASFGQKTLYQNKPVDKIIIHSTLGSHFSKGWFMFKGRVNPKQTKDELIIVFDDQTNSYIIESYKKTKSKYHLMQNGEWNKNNKERIIQRNENVDNKLISDLIDELSIKKRKTSFGKINLSLEEFHKATNRKNVEKFARKSGKDWKLKNRYSTNEMNKIFFNQIKDTIQFNRFLYQLSTKKDSYVTTDAIDEIKIKIISGENIFVFEGQEHYPYRQPFFLVDDDWSYEPIFNLEINPLLVKLLPKNFLLISSIKKTALLNGYINWALDEKEYIRN